MKTLENPLDCKEIQPVNPKGNQSWIFIGRTDAEAKAPILWPPDVKSQLTGKDPDAGKDWRQKEKWTAEDEMVTQHHQLNGQEFEQTLGESERQGSLVCYSPWDHKESVGTWLSNWTIRTTYMDVKVFQIDGGTNVEETMSKDPPKILKEWGEVLRTLLSNNSEKSRGPWTSRKKEHTDGDHRR